MDDRPSIRKLFQDRTSIIKRPGHHEKKPHAFKITPDPRREASDTSDEDLGTYEQVVQQQLR